MNPSDYSEDMKADINERVAKATKLLEELQLQPQASVQSVNMGDDVFAQKVVVYLADKKYVKSPVQV